MPRPEDFVISQRFVDVVADWRRLAEANPARRSQGVMVPRPEDFVISQRFVDAVADWRRLAEAATEGPWVVDEGYGTSFDGTNSTVLYVASAADRSSYIASLGSPIYGDHGDHDAQFIAAARSAVPALLADLDRLQAELAALREAN